MGLVQSLHYILQEPCTNVCTLTYPHIHTFSHWGGTWDYWWVQSDPWHAQSPLQTPYERIWWTRTPKKTRKTLIHSAVNNHTLHQIFPPLWLSWLHPWPPDLPLTPPAMNKQQLVTFMSSKQVCTSTLIQFYPDSIYHNRRNVHRLNFQHANFSSMKLWLMKFKYISNLYICCRVKQPHQTQ